MTYWLAVNALLLVWDNASLGISNLDDSWAGNDVVIGNDLVGLLGEDNVRLASDKRAGWDGDRVRGRRGLLKHSINGTGHSDEVSGSRIDAGSDGQGDLVARLASARGGSDGWESLDGERAVLGCDGLDERSGQGDDLVEVQWDVVWGRERRQLWLLLRTDVGRVTSLGGEDRPSSGQVGGISNVLSGTEVGRNTNTLKDAGEGEESLDVVEAEVVGVCNNRLDTGSGKGTSQELDVACLVSGDGLEVGVEHIVVSGGSEVRLGELGKSLIVEGMLEVLQSEGVVEDHTIAWASFGILALHKGRRNDSSRESGGDDGRTHRGR